ncbi:MAG: excinuclease ABC subunit UvrC [Bacteroidota bacterium]
MAESTHNDVSELVKVLPAKPGIYQFFDDKENIIYVGKAKNLKKRVASYFKKDQSLSGKISVMVKRITDIRHIVVDSELDALLLENNLIKKYQPRYNVMLKDDKTFPWICIKNERFPRIFSTRNIVKDGSEYFGPYASGKMMHTVLELIRSLYPLRNCNHNLSRKNVERAKFKVCLEYHIGNCLGACVGAQTEEDYNQSIQEIREIIKGNISTIIRELKKIMMVHAGVFEFEKAQIIKEKLELLENYQSKSTVVNPKINNVDVFSIITDEKYGYVNFLRVVNGAIVQAHTVELRKKLDESPSDLLSLAITDLRQRFGDSSHELILPFKPDQGFPDIKISVPHRGDKKQLLELSERNAKYYKLEKQKKLDLTDPERHSRRILETMKKDLRMKELPAHIECFDNSNLQGDYPVAAMVCFKNTRPAKKEYRHFNIKTVKGPDDFASMEEIIYRRYKRLLDEQKDLPQLIVIDGGKGQLSSALKSLEKLKLRGRITIIGIAKKLEEIYYPGDSLPMFLDKTSETLRVIRHLRDEAHRFGITHHRKRMEKGTIKSELTDIDGVGFNTAQKLLWKFKSVKKIKDATEQELAEVVGKAKAGMVYDHFRKGSRQ